MPRIAHLSDLHLQSGVPARQEQVEPILQAINDAKPVLVYISGDITDDGWDSIEELRWAKAWLDDRIDAYWVAVPGNHDVGNFASLPEGKIDDSRVRNWQKVFDPLGYGFGGFNGWAIIGINSMVFGSKLNAEEKEFERQEKELSILENAGANIAVVMHSPHFVERPEEKADPATEYWLGPPEARNKMWKRLNQAGVELICSGHVHQSRLTQVDGIQIAWAPPASGTWVHAPGLPNPPMPEKTGFFLHTLHDDGRVESELVECAPMLKCIEFNPWP